MPWTEVPYEQWFATCVPERMRKLRPTEGFLPIAVEDSSRERPMYAALCCGINKLLKAAGSDLRAYSSDDHADTLAPGSLLNGDRNLNATRPDIAVYPSAPEAKAVNEHPKGHGPGDDAAEPSVYVEGSRTILSDDAEDDRLPYTACLAWAWAEIPIQVKYNAKDSPFGAPEHGFLPIGHNPTLARGQLAQYAVECFRRQHRKYVFMISIAGQTARLLCTDRAGTLVSEAFDYEEQPARLGRFFHAYSKMTRAERGFDPTASPASADDAVFFRQLPTLATIDANSAIGRGLSKATTPGWPIYSLDIYAPWSEPDTPLLATDPKHQLASHRCLVGRPAFVSGSATGRGTRGFVAYDLTEEKVVFIKDAWRPISGDNSISSEFDNYQQIYRCMPPGSHMAGFLTLRAGGDVLWPIPSTDRPFTSQATSILTPQAQTTFTQDSIVTGVDTSCRPLPWRHTRLVFKEVCRTLKEFKDVRELVTVVGTALLAHQFAWEDAKLLHRDVSVGNILIHDTPDGRIAPILSDWDLAKSRESLRPGNQRATLPGGRSGTWQFQSALLQCCQGKLYELSDDLESFMHVVNWCALKYLRHALSGPENKAELTMRFHNLFDRREHPRLAHNGRRLWQGSLRFLLVRSGDPFVLGLDRGGVNNPLADLLKQLALLCKQHYECDRIRSLWSSEEDDSSPAVTETDAQPLPLNFSAVDLHDLSEFTSRASALFNAQANVSNVLSSPGPTTNSSKTSPFDTHDLIVSHFLRFLLQGDQVMWPPHSIEKLEDQIASMKDVRPATGSQSGSGTSSPNQGSKRAAGRPVHSPLGRHSPVAGPSRDTSPRPASGSPSGSCAASLLREGTASRPGSSSRLRTQVVATPDHSLHLRSITLPPPLPVPSAARGRLTAQETAAATSQVTVKDLKGKGKARDVA